MKKPILVIMAAGMGSRFGGLKQMTAVDDGGRVIMDFSVYDAAKAGFGRAVIVIKRENEADFRRLVGERIEKLLPVTYAYQELDSLPDGFSVPEGRKKPWGTAHAVLSAADQIDAPFAVINADDYYGFGAFEAVGRFLSEPRGENEHVMAGFLLKNTLTENGAVARGVCETDEKGYLVSVTERTHVETRPNGAAYSLDGGKTFTDIDPDTVVSMNFWGFSTGILSAFREGFTDFLKNKLPADPMKVEYFLPSVVTGELTSGRGTCRVLPCAEKWYGVTYKEDLKGVQDAIARLEKEGKYSF
ncbi:MAG: NTP transferase domain-containing protein [Oscillospiraceae bacterium]|nr:NTP transferase domain-containing protein [Oscillospiraceae bacterium]